MNDSSKSTISVGFCLASIVVLSSSVCAQGTLFVRNQKVGIGTSTPAYDLHLVSSSGSANLWIEGAASGAMEFVDGDAPADERIAQFLSTNGTFRIRGLSDALSQTVPGIVLDLGSGDVGVGTTSPAYRFEIEDTSTTGSILRLQNGDGTCDLDPNVGGLTWSCSSDLRLKTDVRSADTTAILEDLLEMDLYDYDVIASGDHRLGFIAQRMRETYPDRVTASGDGTLMVQQPGANELLAAVQALHGMVAELQGKVADLERELHAREAE